MNISAKGSSNLNPGKSFKIYSPSRVAAHRGCDGNDNGCDASDDVTLAEMHYDHGMILVKWMAIIYR